MNKIRLKKIFTTFLISALLSASFSAFAKDTTDYFSLAKLGRKEQIQAAFKTKSNIKTAVYGSNRETFLMLVLQYDRPADIIKIVIDSGCSVSAKAKDKRTPLMYAAQYTTSAEVLQLIVETDANSQSARSSRITEKDKKDKDSLFYAKMNENFNTYSILEDYISGKEISSSENNSTKKSKDEKKNNETSSGMVTFNFTGSFDEETTEDPVVNTEPEIKPEETPVKAETSPAPSEIKEPATAETKTPEPVKEEIPEPSKTEPVATETTEMPKITPETVAPIQETVSAEKSTAVAETVSTTEQKIEETPVTTKTEIKTYSQVSLFDYAIEQNTVPEKQEKKTESFFTDPNEADDFGVTLLMKAAKAGNDWDVQNLIASGADINLRDKDGWSALMYAVRYQNNLSLVKKLIDNGAHVRVRNVYNATPLLLAADYSQNPEIIKLLLNNRSVAENEVYNAFILCLTSGSGSDHIKMAKVQIFLDMDIALNRIWKGKTPLMYACQYSNTTAIIGQLLAKGAKTNITDKSGFTAFDYAKENTKLVHDDIYWSLNAK